jgi:hypothetical protein
VLLYNLPVGGTVVIIFPEESCIEPTVVNNGMITEQFVKFISILILTLPSLIIKYLSLS